MGYCDICGEPLGDEPVAEVVATDESADDEPQHRVIHQSCITRDYEIA